MLGVIAAVVLAACAAAPEPPPGPQTVSGRILVMPGLNPNVEGRPSPVTIRLYQLRDREAFLDASLQELVMQDTDTLGAALLGRDSYELCPMEMGTAEAAEAGMACQGEVRNLTQVFSPDVRYLAVMAEFFDVRDPAAQWRAVAALPSGKALEEATFTITLDGVRVAVRFD
ncbi:type VI secretion system lipoprotein TssJ [Halomonas campisalis]|uniref:Type VI secretion system lipoprotein TssJ n=1 Tax=Billgrantia campisalis TaxID=74661 RepID=A0ABS9P6S4_9GAMM|nr:type VI secretion system lipoprotein TssJ [Halomonas campisalis]MCG6657485.1 type VI secretion system lipoprotein TssJ [Halomonas campisalis]MDR5863168.1 type VI secretion system lipoprotein TssJ [Halomonas campisalis]